MGVPYDCMLPRECNFIITGISSCNSSSIAAILPFPAAAPTKTLQDHTAPEGRIPSKACKAHTEASIGDPTARA